MDTMRLGRTGLMAGRSGFGALPIQRLGRDQAVSLLRRAHEQGVNFFDTARGYTDSEEKMGLALSSVRKRVIIASKTHSGGRRAILADLETSLRTLRTDYIDIYQLHNPAILPDPDDPDGAYAALAAARREGKIRHIGLTNHRLALVRDAVTSGRYDTIQFPLSLLSSPEELELADLCERHDVGLIAMKALSGGLLTHIPSAFAFLRRYPNILPIWGIQRESELDEFIRLENDPPALDREMEAIIARERAELSGAFCRGCGYCLPCPAGIPIPVAARMTLLLARAPSAGFLSGEWRAQMERIQECRHCGHCAAHCPYGLDTPGLLRQNLEEYRRITGASGRDGNP